LTSPLLDVRGLKVAFGDRETLHGIDLAVAPGEISAIVGESGSGKTLTAMSLMGLLPRHAGVTAGTASFEGQDLLNLSPEARRQVRGRRIGMIFQEPMTSLNPVLSIGRQMTEGPVAHGLATPAEAYQLAIEMLGRVGIAEAPRRLRQYPHEFSGGMRQRVMIAMAMLMKPALLIADEPTTALDVTIQAQILDLLRKLAAETGMAMILITHDMGVVAELADCVLVLRDGRPVEQAQTPVLFAEPRQAYTQALLKAVPRLDDFRTAPSEGIRTAAPILDVRGVSKVFRGRATSGHAALATRALDDVTLSLRPGETLGLVGESGSGKSTLGRAVARLVEVDSGSIAVNGAEMTALRGGALRRARSSVQMIFQDPYASLDPRFSVARTVAEPILIHGKARRHEALDRAIDLLGQVGLGSDMARRFPHELSGGQRQRVAIARALAAEPKIIIADEPTSALDVSIQAQVLDLLSTLQQRLGLALLFISHDLAVVRRMSSRTAVMRAGRILELGPTAALLGDPRHPYTRALLAAAPLPDPAQRNRPRLDASADGYLSGPLQQIALDHWVAS
jgi:ABC-type glutathione transport system ATPase component